MASAAKLLTLALTAGLTWSVGLTRTADAADEQQAAVAKESEDLDEQLQGEYLGVTAPPQKGWNYGSTGLQVVALGDGSFAGSLLAGGLPGAGWDRRQTTALKGTREGSVLKLSGEKLSVVVSDGRAHLLDADGQFRGELCRIVRVSPTLGAMAPPEATVIFNGKKTDELKDPKITEDGLLEVGTQFVNSWRDYTLHVEFRLPFMPKARGQGRANSGVYLQSRYEVQVLDSFGLKGEFNECGALYRSREPDVNMCLPPMQWQTYDICFRAPRFDEQGKKTENARLSVWHNGTLIHDNVSVEGKTGAGAAEGPKPLPIKLQNHGNPVRFRNIWLAEGTDCPSCPYGSPLLAEDADGKKPESPAADVLPADTSYAYGYPQQYGDGYGYAAPQWPMRYGWYGPMPPPRPQVGPYREWYPPATHSAIAYPQIP